MEEEFDYDFEEGYEEYAEDEDGGGRMPAVSKTSSILFVLDASDTMFASKIDGKSVFRVALESLLYTANAMLLLRRHKKRFCVCQIGSDSPDPVLIDFKKPVVDTIKYLENLLDLADPELKKVFSRSVDFCLMDVLNFCVKKLSVYPEAKKFLVFLTNNDDPHFGDSMKNSRTLNIATALKDKIDYCHVLPLKPGFEFAYIYKEILVIFNGTDMDKFTAPGYIDDRELLNEQILSYLSSALWYSKSKLVIKDLVIPVKEYRYLKSVRFSENCRVLRQTNDRVKKANVQNFINVDLGNLEKKIIYENPHDHFKMTFTESEMEHLYPKYERCLKLLYTSDPIFDLRHVLDSPFLVNGIKPRDHFYGLWLSCHKRNKVLVCTYTSGSRKCREKLVCLTPIAKGFLASYATYQDDFVEQFPEDKAEHFRSVNVSDEKLEAAGKLVNSMTRSYKLSNYPHPELAFERARLRALLLERPIIDDGTLGIKEEPSEKVMEAVTEFLRVMQLDVVTKTKRHGENSNPDTKKIKLELSEETVKRMIDEDTLSGLTVDELKNFLKNKNVKGLTGRKKDVLISMVKNLYN